MITASGIVHFTVDGTSLTFRRKRIISTFHVFLLFFFYLRKENRLLQEYKELTIDDEQAVTENRECRSKKLQGEQNTIQIHLCVALVGTGT